jgi:hypothetical protein
MKVLLRRSVRLESAEPAVNHATVQVASIIGERRRKRLATRVETEEELNWSTLRFGPDAA